jgi:hypothetical protein
MSAQQPTSDIVSFTGKDSGKANDTSSPPRRPCTLVLANSKTHYEYMVEIETKINIEIGYRFWKRYVNAAFWSYISLPINLSITMLTALSTGQATTNNLLPKTLYVNISLATLVISILNTYFRPYVQMNMNIEFMNKWSVLGYKYEEIFYSEKRTLEQVDARLEKYGELMKSINELKKTEILESQNFLTDSIHLALRSCVCCLKNKSSWLSLDETLKQEDAEAKRQIQNEEAMVGDEESLPPANTRTLDAGDAVHETGFV